MKQLARTVVYWPWIDTDITNQCHQCQTCAEHQTKPAKSANHPWMLPEKPWSRIHIDHVQLSGSQLVGTGGCLFQIPMYPSFYFNVNQSHHRLTGAGLCSFWVPAHNRLRQCYNILFGRDSGMMSEKGALFTSQVHLSPSYKWSSGASRTDFQTSSCEVLTPTKDCTSRVSHAVPSDSSGSGIFS